MSSPYDYMIGKSSGARKLEYTWREVELYALAVGAKQDQVYYYYEPYLKGIPTYGMVPIWTADGTPQRPGPNAGVMQVLYEMQRKGKFTGGLDWSNDLVIHRPFDPIKGTFYFEDTVTKIYDRGPGKGIVVESECPVYDEAFNLICTNYHRNLFYGDDGFENGDPLPKPEFNIPDTEPDFVVDDHLYELQNCVYRLCSGAYRAEEHIDLDIAKQNGWPGPTMQGFCAMGFACRMAIEALIPGEPERVTRFKADIRGMSFPRDDIQLRGWKTDKGAIFSLVNKKTGKKILDRGIFEYK